ncbi:MAG: cobalt-precorrin-6A reductase [Candidatus Loosdrechtia sp.]|uniref:precorrin-6A/cobalt-precorrin-6A reductase n=1 Tax=Candidatus Loosdrechtia sp. TaxID=3101272 RepID=UPI003A5EB390|nr:MAG: cobalt-precorrin-6A reductase [Candidatus Jettenia sp. AMX2]
MILVISGTEEGKTIVRRLHAEGRSILTTVATEYGRKIFEQMDLESFCLQGRLDTDGFSQLIQEKGIDLVVDATHPYAVQVSMNALNACKKMNIPYLRYERPGTGIPDSPLIHKVMSVDEAVSKARVIGTKIFLTIGVSGVKKFICLKNEKELYVRILPVPEHIASCIDAGIPPMNIIAMHGPFSEDLNRVIFRQYQITTIVTKNSGDAGGISEKISAALREGIETIVIERPRMDFPAVYSSIDEIVARVRNPEML